MSVKKIPLNPEAMNALKRQLKAFEEKFGRPPGPQDPVFFDPDSSVPETISQEKLDRQMMEVMDAAGLDPAFTYAYKKTGLLVTTRNKHLLSRSKRKAWNDAINEYEKLIEKNVQ
jgi:hypothetical protein